MAVQPTEEMMRFLIIVKASAESEAGVMPADALIARMAEFHEELARSGALLDASGLTPSSAGWRIRYEGEQRTLIDGPFAETHELIAGYTLIQSRSREEAQAWTKRFPNPRGEGMAAEIEVRPVLNPEDLQVTNFIEYQHKL
ncbi:MAG: YciI family protein [Azonexus sp.]